MIPNSTLNINRHLSSLFHVQHMLYWMITEIHFYYRRYNHLVIMNSLHIFVKVAETLNMTEAANELYISQPAVSKAIKTMETSLGVKLLIRDKQNKLKLTDAGMEIAVLARQMIVIENKIYQVADQENHLLRGKSKLARSPPSQRIFCRRLSPPSGQSIRSYKSSWSKEPPTKSSNGSKHAWLI